MSKNYGKFEEQDEIPDSEDYLAALNSINESKNPPQILYPERVESLDTAKIIQTAHVLETETGCDNDDTESIIEPDTGENSSLTNQFYHIAREVETEPIDTLSGGSSGCPGCDVTESIDMPPTEKNSSELWEAYEAPLPVNTEILIVDETKMAQGDPTSAILIFTAENGPTNIPPDVECVCVVEPIPTPPTSPQTIDLRTQSSPTQVDTSAVQNMREMLRVDINQHPGLSEEESEQYDRMHEEAGRDKRINRGGRK